MNFIQKIVKRKKESKTQTIKSNTIEGIVIFDNSKLLIQLKNKSIYELYKYNDVDGILTVYSSPTNDAHPLWTKQISKNKHRSHQHLVNLSWWRYKPGMKLKGEVIDNIFHPKGSDDE